MNMQANALVLKVKRNGQFNMIRYSLYLFLSLCARKQLSKCVEVYFKPKYYIIWLKREWISKWTMMDRYKHKAVGLNFTYLLSCQIKHIRLF